jgi:hypothetical protein
VWPWLKRSFCTRFLLHNCLPYTVRPVLTPCSSILNILIHWSFSLETHIAFTQNYSFFSCLDYWEALNLADDVFLLKLQNMWFLIWHPKTLFILVPYDIENINKTPFFGGWGRNKCKTLCSYWHTSDSILSQPNPVNDPNIKFIYINFNISILYQ